MAISGFGNIGGVQQPGKSATGGFNQAAQALELQKQIRGQLGISAHPLEAPPNDSFLTPEQRGQLAELSGPQGEILKQQLTDQWKAQAIFRAIGQDQRNVKQAREMGIPPSQVTATPAFGLREPEPQAPTQAHGMNFQQIHHFMNMMMQMMVGFAQLGNGFSSFLGGGPAYPQYARPF